MAKNSASKKPNTKLTYYFGAKKTEGRGVSKKHLGGKGANLANMTALKLPVPPGFTITTDCCDAYYKLGGKFPPGLMDDVKRNIGTVEKELGKKFGDASNPLLVSVRSGAAVSMPGMMDTVLNLGLNDKVVQGLADATNNPRFAYDAYRRLINMFGDVVMGVDHHKFEQAFNKIKKKYKAKADTDVPAEGMQELCDAYKATYKQYAKEPFPQNPLKQLEKAIEAVFKSWHTPRAVTYREIEGIRGLLGTAVNVQSMVYGNMGDDCGTGVCFTRDNATGDNRLHGDFLVNAQGEDVVAGIRPTESISYIAKWNPAIMKELTEVKRILESHFSDMQDLEFTVERGKLYMLQTRNGKRTGAAAVKIACDMVREKLIDEKEALLRIPANDLRQLMLPSFDPAAKKTANVLTIGLNASPGAATGTIAFSADEAEKRAGNGEDIILVRRETSPEDIHGMWAAKGILTSTGGKTSHAAVVAVGWGKCCVAGAKDVEIDEAARTVKVGGRTLGDKDVISLDGSTGEVMLGEIGTVEPSLGGDFAKIMKWSDKYRTLRVRTNADTPTDSQKARDFGAQGIGLCRTEHMFFDPDRILAMREMILVDDEKSRRKALKKLLPHQRKDFEGIFKAMKGLPVTIRLLDPPLHEFLPHDEKSQAEVAKQLGVSPAQVKSRVTQLHEANPMLGHRGCRLSITYPEILEMQVRAIVEALINCKKKKIDARPEIMIPLVGMVSELEQLRPRVEATIKEVKLSKKYTGRLNILIGTMIEIPRAALTADEVAAQAEFFSFGTNDLTQMAYGFSRDDIGTFLPEYLKKDIVHVDPFESIDQTGVGQLIEIAVTKGRKARSDIKLGICGEHGGDPDSIDFCHRVGLDYVSCSPFRVPIARLSAAQAAIRHG